MQLPYLWWTVVLSGRHYPTTCRGMDLEFIFNKMVDPRQRVSVVRTWPRCCWWWCSAASGSSSLAAAAAAVTTAAFAACNATHVPCDATPRAGPQLTSPLPHPHPCARAVQALTLGVAARPQMALATSSTAWAFNKMHLKGEDGEPVLRPFIMETKFDGGLVWGADGLRPELHCM